MSLPIGNLADASEAQFIAFYKRQQPQQYTQDQFVQELKNKQEQAIQDCSDLQSINTSSLEVGSTLVDVAGTAEDIYQLQREKFWRSIKSFAADVDGIFSVSGFDIYQGKYDRCDLCDRKIPKPVTYRIVNKKIEEEISVYKTTLHKIVYHSYFDKIDPIKACRVLQLGQPQPRS